MKKIAIVSVLLVSSSSVGAHLFKRHVNEVQVYQDRVRVHTGGTYGTCGERDGWFGWKTSNERHKDWLSLVLVGKASGAKVTMYDQHNSCNGMSDAVEVEGVFLPLNE